MRAGVSIFGFFLLTGSLLGQAPEKIQPLPPGLPPLGPLRIVSPPTVKAYRLSSGMQIWLVRRPDLPKVELNLVLKGGDSLDPPSMPELAQVLAKAVTQGTSTRSAQQIADAAQFTGGEISSRADVDSVSLRIDSLSEYASQALNLLGDVSRDAAFSAEQVASTRRNFKNALSAQRADPHFLAQEALLDILYPGQPYRILSPSPTTVRDVTSYQLRALYGQTFRPDRALLIVVGQFQPQTMLKQIKRNFGRWKATGRKAASPQPPAERIDHRIYIVARPQSVQTTLLIGASVPALRNAEEPVLELADAIYGSGFNSRLRKNIREDKGYSYHPGSAIETHSWGATVETLEDVRNSVTGPSLKETLYELKRMATEPPTGQELTNGKRYVIGNIALDMHSRRGIGEILENFWVQGVPPDSLEKKMEITQKATTADVQRAAEEYLAPSRMTVVAVGEKKTIGDQLQSFGIPILDAPKAE